MSKNLADYNLRNVTDINALYPENLKNDFITGLNETVFNRFLTKSDYVNIIGAIGNDDLSSTIRNILEDTTFAQDNQLQPLLSATRGSTDLFMTWGDFIRKLTQQDVDVDSFDTWGRSTQFNWVPPINLDKFINYRDYYWDTTVSDGANPNYITIENVDTTRSATLQELLKHTFNVIQDAKVVTSYSAVGGNITIAGNYPTVFPAGLDIILKYTNNLYDIVRIVSSTFNVITSSTDIVVDRLQDLPLDSIMTTKLTGAATAIDPTQLSIIGGNYVDLFGKNYIFSIFNSDGSISIVSVDTSTYDLTSNVTTLKLNQSIPLSTTSLSTSPLLLSAYNETIYENGYYNTITYDANSLYEILWAYHENKIESVNGVTYLNVDNLTDNSVDFITSNVAVGDIISIKLSSGEATTAIVDSIIDANNLSYTTTEGPYIFTGSSIEYAIYTKKTTNDYNVQPLVPNNGDVWVDTVNDTITAFDGLVWDVKVNNFSVLNSTVSTRKVEHNKSKWSTVNAWIHRTQLQSISDKIRAHIPIIEFYDTLLLADMSEVTHTWSYRKDDTTSFNDSEKPPSTFELFDIIKVDSNQLFEFVDSNTIIFSPRYGNMTDSLVAGSKISLSGFQYNSGAYTVSSSEFVQIAVGGNKLTRVTVDNTISDINDRPVGSRIAPYTTAYGDRYVSAYINWRYDGIADIVSTSKQPIKNDIYSLTINVSSNGITESKNGYNWQSFRPVSDIQVNPIFSFAVPLHAYCLYDDYQEGDIRVYINKVRQYGNFIETPSYIDDRFVGGIQFIDGTTITLTDVVLIEVGEYANIDAGRRSVLVNTPSGYETSNLSRYKKVEQFKLQDNQYPEFVVVDSETKERYSTSSIIFSYLEDATAPVNPYMSLKLALDDFNNSTSFKFKQHLKDGEAILAYEHSKDGAVDYSTIWRVGLGLEQYVPNKNVDGVWNIPNQWYYNQHHKNKDTLSYNELYTHFRSIIQSQSQIGVPSSFNTYFADYSINYGLGGTIKEHNGNFDILAATTFTDVATVEEIINFSKTQYDNALYNIRNLLLENASTLFSTTSANYAELVGDISQAVLDDFESNSNMSIWFGDSSSFDGVDGVRNWVPTLPMMSMVKPVKPFITYDESIGLNQLIHHDGHRSDIYVTPAAREQIYNNILASNNHTTDVVASNAQPFPGNIDGIPVVNGDYLLRTNTVERTRTLYRYNSSAWERVSITEVLTKVLLFIEEKLYNISLKLYSDIYAIDSNYANANYTAKMEKQFSKYASESGIVDPLSSKDSYISSNPYTWNYHSFAITALPFVGAVIAPAADWRQLYSNAFGTPYPHLEPWSLQGYSEEPSWWNATYYDTINSTYFIAMWDNIFDGIVPTGNELPDGTISTGVASEVGGYVYLPVVTSVAPTADGLPYGSIIPPYWDSSAALGDVRIRSLFDPNSGDEIAQPQLDATFGQYGSFEYEWFKGIDYNYSQCIANFKLDPMNFVSAFFGYSKYTVDYLELHTHSKNIQPSNSAVLHGESIDGEIVKFCGLNELYVLSNRYNGHDSTNSDFNSIWKSSSINLGYLFNSVIDTSGFNISSNLLDIANNDYNIAIKNTKNYSVNKLDSLYLTLISMPSKYIGDSDKGWTFEVSTIPTEKTKINYYKVQNYSCSPSGDTMVVNSSKLYDVEFTSARNEITIDYGSSLQGSTLLNWVLGNTYTMTVTVNGVPTLITVDGSLITVDELIVAMNLQLTDAYFELELNNLILSGTSQPTTIAISDVDILSSIAGFVSIGTSTVVDAQFDGIFKVRGNLTDTFIKLSALTITNSVTFNGTYTVNRCTYDYASDITNIEINENVTIPNVGLVVDGIIFSDTSATLPDSWETGFEVYFNSYDDVYGLSTERPYYIIRNSATSFTIADSAALANNGIYISLADVTISGMLYVGKLERTFKVGGGATTDINWRVHSIDDREASYIYDGVSFTGMQNVVDFLTGFAGYNVSNGFTLNNNFANLATGRPNSWQLDVEQLIDWSFTQRAVRQESKIEYDVTFDPSDDSVNFVDYKKPSLGAGSTVLLLTVDGATLPDAFTSSDVINVPYYIVNTTSDTQIKLARTSYDAARGIYVNFNQPSTGKIILQSYTKLNSNPGFLYAPFANQLTIAHDVGLLSDVFNSGSYVYGLKGELLDSSQLFVSRRDKESQISLLGQILETNDSGATSTYICGGKFTTETYEHVLVLNDYTLSGQLIYDDFLGLRTPRMVVEFNRQQTKTLRPTLGGYVLLDGKLVQNMESAIGDSRYYYDDIKAEEQKQTTTLTRQSLGYGGEAAYMSDLGLTDKSQFLFWKGMIQNKGTNVAAYAFTNQSGLSGAELDEFWAYKLATFGGDGIIAYPEMKLLGEDVDANELRLEFVPPNGSGLYESFKQIYMTDATRWFNQPDQIASLAPYNTLFFTPTVLKVITNVESRIVELRSQKILILDHKADGAIITYVATDGTTKLLSPKLDYEFISSTMIKFIETPAFPTLENITVSTLTYDFDAQNPSKIIDRVSGSVVSDVPFWNPAAGQYDNKYVAPISRTSDTDPATYSNELSAVTTPANLWLNDHTGFIWMDTHADGYIPYYDEYILPNIDDRIFNWGKLAKWADIELYQWTRSTLLPSAWDIESKRQTNDLSIPDEQRVTGTTRKLLYMNSTPNTPTATWVQLYDIHYDFIAGTLDSGSAPDITGSVEVYVNGIFKTTNTVDDANDILYIQDGIPLGHEVHLIKRAYVPTTIEVQEQLYKYDTPYTTEIRTNSDTGKRENVYYYWVSGKFNTISYGGKNYTLSGMRDGIKTTKSPYMILQGLRTSGSGYGLVYGNVFDEFENTLPYRYTQVVVKGLSGKVKSEDRYTLRFTKDYNLRDTLGTSLHKKNVHVEWKLFRQKQSGKVDRYLWDRMVESIVGYQLIGSTSYDSNIIIPELNRTVYDNIYGTDTRIGMSAGQTFCDKDVAIATIQFTTDALLKDVPDNIRILLQAFDPTSPESTIATLSDIYVSAAAKYVNEIFFNVMYDALVAKKEHREIFKTSWVAIQASQEIQSYNESVYSGIVHNLVATQ